MFCKFLAAIAILLISALLASEFSPIGSNMPVPTIPPTLPANFGPNAVFVGATSGIGQHMAQQLAAGARAPTKIVIVGRNKVAAEEIIARMQNNSNVEATFLACDVTSMANVKKLAEEIQQKFDKVNLLVMSPGVLTMAGRTETEDGVDRKVAAHYYSRFTLAHLLMPQLEKAVDEGEEARVMSVLAAGYGGHIYLDDLALKDNFGLKAAADGATTYNDLMVESFSLEHPRIGFFHIAPGAVATSLAEGLPWYARIPLKVFGGLITKSPDTCAAYMLKGLLDPSRATGWHLLNQYGEPVSKSRYHTEEARKAVWQHSLDVAKLD